MSTPQAPWTEVVIKLDPAAYEAVADLLFEKGCQGLVQEPEAIRAYFPSHIPVRKLLREVEVRLEGLSPPVSAPLRWHATPVPHNDWGRSWRRFYGVQRITRRLTLVPAWEPIPQEPSGVVLYMDPGPAFGTGQHATTRMCLRAMEQVCPSEGPWSFLDVGTGSGILAIYGVKLGARPVIALDIDPEAVRWARRNLALNGCAGDVQFLLAPPEAVKGQFTAVCANLVLSQIRPLLPELTRLTRPSGCLILSGILQGQVEGLRTPWQRAGLFMQDLLTEEGWACLILRRRP